MVTATVALAAATQQEAVPEAVPSTSSAAMVVTVDPDTGKLRAPSPAEAAALADEVGAAREPALVERRRADGTRHVHLGSAMLHYATADVGDGRLHTGCSQSPAHAEVGAADRSALEMR